jgi:hypothetical protein
VLGELLENAWSDSKHNPPPKENPHCLPTSQPGKTLETLGGFWRIESKPPAFLAGAVRRERGEKAFCAVEIFAAPRSPAGKRVQREGAPTRPAFRPLSSPSGKIKTPPRATWSEDFAPRTMNPAPFLRRRLFAPWKFFCPLRSLRPAKGFSETGARRGDFSQRLTTSGLIAENSARAYSSPRSVAVTSATPAPPPSTRSGPLSIPRGLRYDPARASKARMPGRTVILSPARRPSTPRPAPGRGDTSARKSPCRKTPPR